jgi:hypothetical protein
MESVQPIFAVSIHDGQYLMGWFGTVSANFITGDVINRIEFFKVFTTLRACKCEVHIRIPFISGINSKGDLRKYI